SSQLLSSLLLRFIDSLRRNVWPSSKHLCPNRHPLQTSPSRAPPFVTLDLLCPCHHQPPSSPMNPPSTSQPLRPDILYLPPSHSLHPRFCNGARRTIGGDHKEGILRYGGGVTVDGESIVEVRRSSQICTVIFTNLHGHLHKSHSLEFQLIPSELLDLITCKG
ncbi:hypothetical protein LINPERHAP1_LOCUS19482, partial [Linum perenne]